MLLDLFIKALCCSTDVRQPTAARVLVNNIFVVAVRMRSHELPSDARFCFAGGGGGGEGMPLPARAFI